MAPVPKARKPKRPSPRSCLGPVADLEQHLPAEWWRKLFNALYVKTDGDVVENNENTRREVDFIVGRRRHPAAQPHPRPLLRAGASLHRTGATRFQERHRRGPLALSRAPGQEACARRRAERRFQGRRRAQPAAAGEQLRLRCHHGQLVRLFFEQAGRREGSDHGRQASCVPPASSCSTSPTAPTWRTTSIAAPGSGSTSITSCAGSARFRPTATASSRAKSSSTTRLGVIADQFYAERLYTREGIAKLLEKCGFRNVRHHGNAEALSDRDQDLGMMARRLLISADAPQLPARKPRGKLAQIDVTVLLGDPRLPDTVKLGGAFSDADLDTVRASRMRCPSSMPTSSAISTITRRSSATSPISGPISFSICATRVSTTIPSRSCTFRRCWMPGPPVHGRRRRRRSRPATTRASCAPSP